MPTLNSTAQSGMERAELAQREKDRLNKAFQKSLEDTRSLDTETLVEKVQEYRDEIETAAEVAKVKLDGELGGSDPESGDFGLDYIHPGYFGYDDWDNIPDLTGGEANDWLDSHTPTHLASGAGGDSFTDPLGIGEPAVHIILGVGSYAPSSATTRVKFELNDQPQTAINTENAFRQTDLRVKWLDNAILLRPDDNVAARVFAGGQAGQTYSESLYPVGLSFIEARKMRHLDPVNMAGAEMSNIVVER